MQRNMIRSIVRFFFNRLPRVEVSGLENIPDEGGYILASNHLSRLDAPLIFTLVEREDVSVLVADKYQKNPFLRGYSILYTGSGSTGKRPKSEPCGRRATTCKKGAPWG